MEDVTSSVEDLNEVTKKISVTVPFKQVKAQYESTITSYMGRVRLKGFRPGKAPRAIVEKQFGTDLKNDVAIKLIESTLDSVIKKHELNVVGRPSIDWDAFATDTPLVYRAQVALFPNPEVKKYTQRTLEVVKRTVSDEDVEKAVADLRDKKSELKKIEDRKEAQAGDVIASSVTVTVEGQEAGRPEPYVETLGSGRLPKEVEDKIVGMAIGEDRQVEITAGDDHPSEEARGKKLTYSISLHGLFDKKLPEMTEEFIKGLGLEVSTVEELNKKVRQQLETEYEESNKHAVQEELIEQLITDNEFLVPQVMIDGEIEWMLRRWGLGDRANDSIKQMFEPQALKRIKATILIDRIGEQEKIKVEDEDREKAIKEMAEKSGRDEKSVRSELSKNLEAFNAELFRTKVLEFLMNNNTVKEKKEEKDGKKKEAKEKKEKK